jgi:hypothetical protein
METFEEYWARAWKAPTSDPSIYMEPAFREVARRAWDASAESSRALDADSKLPVAGAEQVALTQKTAPIDLVVALISESVAVTRHNPDLIEFAEQGLTQTMALRAVAIARERGKERPHFGYLKPIIREMLQPSDEKVMPDSATMRALRTLEGLKS